MSYCQLCRTASSYGYPGETKRLRCKTQFFILN